MCPPCNYLSRVSWYTHINACRLIISVCHRRINPHKILSPTRSIEVGPFQELNDVIKDPGFFNFPLCHSQCLPTFLPSILGKKINIPKQKKKCLLMNVFSKKWRNGFFQKCLIDFPLLLIGRMGSHSMEPIIGKENSDHSAWLRPVMMHHWELGPYLSWSASLGFWTKSRFN